MEALTHIGKYEVVDLLGEGAMGVVYKALDPVLHRNVAVKVMGDALARDEVFRDRFMREARAAGSLQHPNVVTIYDCGEVDGHLYIAMEYLSGADLEFLLDSHAPMTMVAKLDIMIDVLQGLAYAHKRGIVHRDVKPANIRISDEGRALIMDFGIAHLASSDITRTGLVLGTPNYMAPEQVSGGAITAQTDIFAVGVVLYELLAGKRPFEGGNLHSILFKIIGEQPDPIQEIVPGIKPELVRALDRALAKDPADRFGDATEFANTLARIRAAVSEAPGETRVSLRDSIRTVLAQVPGDHRTGSDKQTAAKPARARSRVGMALASLLVVALIGAVFVFRGRPTPRQVVANDTATIRQSGARTQAVATPTTPSAGEPSAPVTPPPRAEPGQLRESSILRVVQANANEARRRAIDAGATEALLQAGDVHRNAAERAMRSGQLDDAAAQFSQASNAWNEAERSARASRTVALTTPAQPVTPPKELSKPTIAAPAASSAVPPPQPSAVAAAPQLAPPQANTNATADIAAAVADYARAIEARDIAALRRVYPGMTPSQQSAFEDFFRSVRTLRAGFTTSNLQVDGNTAEARLSGTYDFVTGTGQTEHQPLTLQATLKREASGWRFVSIR
jgi:eukaryotic-like serine/threonine-protein kinase